MATLAELASWTAGIYQLETTDPVLGGPDGIDNRQAKELANRTLWLKQQIELATDGLTAHLAAPDDHPQYALKVSPEFSGTPRAPTPAVSTNSTQIANTAFVHAALAALVDSSPAALDTLKELATALGDDPNFAATMAAALGYKAPLFSPALTGVPTAPTAAPGTKTTQLATTAFVDSALTGAITTLSVDTVLTTAQLGLVLFSAAGGNRTVTLPAANGATGVRDVIIRRTDTSTNTLNIVASGTDKIMTDTPAGLASWPLLFIGDWLHLRSDAAGKWWAVGAAMLPASNAETIAGLDARRYVTAVGLAARLAGLPFVSEDPYISPPLSWVSGGPITLDHGLDGEPIFFIYEYRCKAADAGFAVGGKFFAYPAMGASASDGLLVRPTPTQLIGRWGSTRVGSVLNIATGGITNLTASSWDVVIRAYK